VGVASRPRCGKRVEGKSNAFGASRRGRSNGFEDGRKGRVWRTTTTGRNGRWGAEGKVSGLEAMNGEGVGFGTNLEAKGMWETLEDLEGAFVKGSQRRMDWRREDKNMGGVE
jgi:hypothetical protein